MKKSVKPVAGNNLTLTNGMAVQDSCHVDFVLEVAEASLQKNQYSKAQSTVGQKTVEEPQRGFFI